MRVGMGDHGKWFMVYFVKNNGSEIFSFNLTLVVGKTGYDKLWSDFQVHIILMLVRKGVW